MLSTELRITAKKVEDLEDNLRRLRMVSSWVILAHERPEESPKTLDFQINQLKETITIISNNM